jgi:hypothetical protein
MLSFVLIIFKFLIFVTKSGLGNLKRELFATKDSAGAKRYIDVDLNQKMHELNLTFPIV